MQTPKKVFGITADHVIKECLEVPSKDGYSCGLFPVNYSMRPADLIEFDNLEDRMIDRSERRDIATFRITEDELRRLDVSVASKWPPVLPEPGNGVAFCGFPSDGRARVLQRSGLHDIVVSFMVFPVMAIATSASQHQITYVFERDDAVATQGFVIPPTDLDLGGTSGGPAFTKIETPSGIEHWAPAGVIYTKDV